MRGREPMGVRGTKIHNTWRGMKERCNNINHARYKDYGGRGICICKEWENFHSFFNWAISNGYSEGLTIGRINNDGNYEPSNCRWETSSEQSLNTRRSLLIEINGEVKTLKEWSIYSNLNYGTIKWRYYQGVRGNDLISPITRYSIPIVRRCKLA